MSKIEFKTLVAPIEPEVFFSEYWESKPLFVARGENAYYRDLLSDSDIEFITSAACALSNSSIELVGKKPGAPELQKPDRITTIYRAYNEGASIRVRGVDRYWKPIWMLCRDLEEVFNFPVATNLYCSPAGSHGLDRHYDQHDVFVVQIAGRKHWRVFESPNVLPLQYVPPLSFEKRDEMDKYRGAPKMKDAVAPDAHGPALYDVVMESGDMLYLPRGFVHEAWTSDSSSVHLTVGVHVITWTDLLTVALGQLAHQDPNFRKALPVGFAGDPVSDESFRKQFGELLKTFSERADMVRAVEEIAESFIWNQQALGEGAFAAPAAKSRIEIHSLLERRSSLLLRLAAEGDTVALCSSLNVLSMPRFFEEQLRFVAGSKVFRVEEIPGRMSDNSKLAMVRRLVKEGFLRVVEE